jgi:hypothetical protein
VDAVGSDTLECDMTTECHPDRLPFGRRVAACAGIGAASSWRWWWTIAEGVSVS